MPSKVWLHSIFNWAVWSAPGVLLMPCWIAVALYVISCRVKCGLRFSGGSGGGTGMLTMRSRTALAISPSTTCRSNHLIMSLWLIIVLPSPHEATDEGERGCERCRQYLGELTRLVAFERSLCWFEPPDTTDVTQQDDTTVQRDDERNQIERRLERIEAHDFPGKHRSRIILRCSACPASEWIKYQAAAMTNNALSSSTLMISGLVRSAGSAAVMALGLGGSSAMGSLPAAVNTRHNWA